jgi:hypothetical protein
VAVKGCTFVVKIEALLRNDVGELMRQWAALEKLQCGFGIEKAYIT